MSKRINGKAKGNGFERDIANKLSSRFELFTGISKSFRRNPDSGSFFGASNQSRLDEYDTDYAIFGDLICPRTFKFAIECKNYKTPPSFNSIIKQKVTEWDEWIEQSLQDAENSNKMMMLVIKYNRTDVFVITDHKTETVPAGIYQSYFLYRLDDILELDDNYFFEIG